MMNRIAFLFRTHFWDAYAERMAGHASAQFGLDDFFICADHSRSAFNCGSYKVVGHKVNEMAKIGLPARPAERTMWYNADYAFIDAMLKLPDYDYYMFSEYDVRFNIDFTALRARIIKNKVDFYGPNFSRVDSSWRHFDSTSLYYKNVFRMLPVVTIFSKRFLEHLFAKRVEFGKSISRDKPWPYCESFLASEAVAGEFNLDPMLDFFLTWHCRFGPPMLEAAANDLLPNEIRHPVLSQERYPTWLRQPLKRVHCTLKGRAFTSVFG